jgi:hypothetical protein
MHVGDDPTVYHAHSFPFEMSVAAVSVVMAGSGCAISRLATLQYKFDYTNWEPPSKLPQFIIIYYLFPPACAPNNINERNKVCAATPTATFPTWRVLPQQRRSFASNSIFPHSSFLYYSSFLLALAMRADRLPPGVMTVPVLFSMGVPLTVDDVSSLFVVGCGVLLPFLDAAEVGVVLVGAPVASLNWTLLPSLWAEILDKPRTNKNPNKPIWGTHKGGK